MFAWAVILFTDEITDDGKATVCRTVIECASRYSALLLYYTLGDLGVTSDKQRCVQLRDANGHVMLQLGDVPEGVKV